jgi:hypothetical protein
MYKIQIIRLKFLRTKSIVQSKGKAKCQCQNPNKKERQGIGKDETGNCTTERKLKTGGSGKRREQGKDETENRRQRKLRNGGSGNIDRIREKRRNREQGKAKTKRDKLVIYFPQRDLPEPRSSRKSAKANSSARNLVHNPGRDDNRVSSQFHSISLNSLD